jgi:DNA invertase Pin-like site-specific DNA recombinase
MPVLTRDQIQARAERLRRFASSRTARRKAAKKAVKKVVAPAAPVAPAVSVEDKMDRAARNEVRGLLKDLYKAGLQDVADKLDIDYNSKTTNEALIGAILYMGKKTDYGMIKAIIDKL